MRFVLVYVVNGELRIEYQSHSDIINNVDNDWKQTEAFIVWIRSNPIVGDVWQLNNYAIIYIGEA